jgi:hypothetical protein
VLRVVRSIAVDEVKDAALRVRLTLVLGRDGRGGGGKVEGYQVVVELEAAAGSRGELFLSKAPTVWFFTLKKR